MNWKWSSLALGAVFVTAHAAPAQVAKVGDKMSYTFNQPLLNGQGVKTLADLHGKPVVVEFWGTH